MLVRLHENERGRYSRNKRKGEREERQQGERRGVVDIERGRGERKRQRERVWGG